MKLTKREKILLVFLGVIIIIAGYYQFIFKYQFQKVTELEEKAITYKEKVEETKEEISSNKKVNEELKVMNEKINFMTQRLFPIINQEKIIVILDELLKESDITGNSIVFSGIEKKVIEEKKKEEITINENSILEKLVEEYTGKKPNKSDEKEIKSEDKEEDRDNPEDNIENMEVVINYEGKYDDILKFLQELENLDKRIIVKDIKMTNKTESNTRKINILTQIETIKFNLDNTLTGNINLSLYAIPKLSKQDEEYLRWDYDNGYGKKNPFIGVGNSSLKNLAITKKDSNKIEYNFGMTVKPISSDLPTIVLGKTKDSLRTTYVYADNEGVEDVDIYFIQKDNKYFYKYKTSSYSYPKDFNEDIEFNANGSINIGIYSTNRNSLKDMAGANVHIHNMTDKKVFINITGDDPQRQRVNIIKEEGVVQVLRN